MGSWISTPTSAPTRAERGIVHRGATADLFDLRRAAVGPRLLPFASHLWEVRWDRRGGPPRGSRTIPFPAVNLTVEGGTDGVRHGHPLPAALVHGVPTCTFDIDLAGAGWVVGVKFRPGGWAAWTGLDAAALTDRVLPAGPLLAPLDLADLPDAVLAAGPDERLAVLRDRLERHAPEPRPDDLRVVALVERMRDDPALVRVEQLPGLVGWSARTLHRRFRRAVGVSPKWVLARYRLQEAAVALERCPDADLAALSVRLGWHDQAHFTNDFRRALGTTPARYAAAARDAARVPSPPRAR